MNTRPKLWVQTLNELSHEGAANTPSAEGAAAACVPPAGHLRETREGSAG